MRLWILLLLCSGCIAKHTVAPPPVAMALDRAELNSKVLVSREFTVEGKSNADRRGDVEDLRDSLLQYVTASTKLGDVRILPRARKDTPFSSNVLIMDTHLVLDHVTYRTYILDLLNIYPLLGTFAPWWGHADVELEVLVSRPGEEPHWRWRKSASREFSAIFFTWWRRRFVEDAFANAYGELFTDVSQAFAADAGFIGGGTSKQVALKTFTAEQWERAEAKRLGYPFLLIEDKPAPSLAGPTGLALNALGGVEGSFIRGFARVSSGVRDEQGHRVEVAAGNAAQRGYRVALYSAPTFTGFFAYPTVGWVSQNIDIGDFRETMPKTEEIDGATDIDAVCSTPSTGESVDCAAPNIYRLHMESTYAGGRAGVNVVGGNRYLELFGSLSAGVNLVEYRSMRARVAQYRSQSEGVEWLQSGAVGGTFGFRLPQLHTALRMIVDYELYRKFRYEEPLEFKGGVVYNEDKQIYERPRTFVRNASLSSLSLQWALAVTF